MRPNGIAEDIVGLPPVANAVRVALRYTTESIPMFNIVHVLCPAPATAANLVTIAGVFQSWWQTEMRTGLSSATVWQGADLTALDSPGSPFLAYTNTGTANGAFAGTCYPPNVSLCVSLRTGLSGRSFRGRLYMPGVSTVAPIASGLHSVASIVFWTPLYNALRTRLITAGFQWCVVSYYSGMTVGHVKIPRAAGLATPITTIVIGRRSDSMRSRLPVGA